VHVLRQERYVDAGDGVVEATVNVETVLESEAAKNGEAHLAVIVTRCVDVVSHREKPRGEISLVDFSDEHAVDSVHEPYCWRLE
jgi:hypothetical protein